MSLRLLGLAAGLLLIAADKPDDATKKDLEKLQGTWNVQSMTRGGKDAPAEEVAKHKLVIEGEKFLPQTDGKKDAEATFKLDATKKPPAIDVTNKDGEIALGIYQIDGDTLKLAVQRPGGKDRPTEFTSPADSEVSLMVLKREKK